MPAAQADPPRPRGAGRPGLARLVCALRPDTGREQRNLIDFAGMRAASGDWDWDRDPCKLSGCSPDAYTTVQYMKGYLYKYPCVLRLLFKTGDTVEY